MKTATRVLVRADAGAAIGSGHVMRCLSIVGSLGERGAIVQFATCSPSSIRRRITELGIEVLDLDPASGGGSDAGGVWSATAQRADAAATLEHVEVDPDIVVVDHYGLGEPWERAVSARSGRIVVIDDLANRRHRCDALVDQNWYGDHTAHRYDDLVDEPCTLLLGPRYAILQPAYEHERRRRRPAVWPPHRLVVSFGGTDPAHETEKVLAALQAPEFDELDVTVVVGTPERRTPELEALIAGRPRTTLLTAVPSLAPVLARADLAIGASGAATWERLCLGVPAIVATTAPHQSGVTEALAATGVTDWVGLTATTTIETYRAALRRRCSVPTPPIPGVVDGHGAGRIAELIAPTDPSELDVTPASEHDAPVFAGLAAEAGGVGPSLLDGPAAWFREHAAHVDRLRATDRSSFVVTLGGVPVGGVVIGPGADAEVTLVDAVAGRGLADDVLTALGRPTDGEPTLQVVDRNDRGTHVRVSRSATGKLVPPRATATRRLR